MFAHGDSDWPGLAKLAEEANKILHVIGRLMQTHGQRSHWADDDLKRSLRDEMADVAAAIHFVMEVRTVGYGMTDDDRKAFSTRFTDKLATFKQFHREKT